MQGVGFRYFVERTANVIGVQGWVRNLDDGSVEAHASGSAEQLSEFEGYLWKGPRWSEVRGVDVEESVHGGWRGFQIRH